MEIPIVSYLILDPGGPHLEVTSCATCSAGYLGSRIACARCGGRSFDQRDAATTGTVASFTIVHRAAPGVPAPFVSALVRLDDGTMVKGNIVLCPPDPDHVWLGMPVSLRTFNAGSDDEGNHAIAFGFAPLGS